MLMKTAVKYLLVLLSAFNILYAQNYTENFYYLDPLPESKYINPTTTVIIRPKENIDINTLRLPGAITVRGTISGNRNFTSIIADSGKVVILKLTQHFIVNDIGLVGFSAAIKKNTGESIEPFEYGFAISNNNTIGKRGGSLLELINSSSISSWNKAESNTLNTNSMLRTGVPQITVTYSHFPSTGKLFFNNLVRTPVEPNTPCLLIVDNDGRIVLGKEMPDQVYDLNLQPNGLLTYFDDNAGKYYGMNKNYNIVDSFACGNGYTTDLHELKILPNGNYLIMSYDRRAVDSIGSTLSAVSSVIGTVIQEIDTDDNVIFQWRSWDYFKITDATHENLNAALIDYCHGNAIEHDYDGHYMLSSRNMDEITKINSVTGNTIWRLGGKNNQFDFVNDTIGFSHQHAIRRLPNGNVTLYDNGNFHVPPFSRAIEYKLDEVNKTAEIVWQYRNTPDIFAPATGYVQRLPNNNTLICWGLTNPTLTEVRYDGTKVLEMTLPPGVFSYRAYKYDWNEEPNTTITPAAYSLLQNYPNPFNPSTTIKFTVPRLAGESSLENVKLSIYDLTGRLVKVLVNEAFTSGTYSVNYDASTTSSGVYFYKAEIGSFTDTKKMILVK